MLDSAPLLAYVELCVGDDRAVVEHYVRGFQFEQVAVAVSRASRSTLLRSNNATVIVTTPTSVSSRAADYLARHGDGVCDIALYHQDLPALLKQASRAGLEPISPLTAVRDGNGSLARVEGTGSVHHTLVSTPPHELPPGFDWDITPIPSRSTHPQVSRAVLARPQAIDHLAWCLPGDSLESVAARYREAFSMEIISTQQITAGPSVTNSYALQSKGLTFVFTEADRTHQPDRGGQIDAFIDSHSGAGVQHIAFSTNDIVAAVRLQSLGGVEFLDTPSTYYDLLPKRVSTHPAVAAHLAELRAAKVLVDADNDGLLYQIFTTSPHHRRALFYELIQRVGGRGGFGQGNVRALFEARARALAEA